MAVSICRRYSIPPQDAEDLMQQSLVAFIDRQSEIEHPQAWLAGTLRNHCLMYWRRRRRCLYRAVDAAILETLAEPTPSEAHAIEFAHDMAQVLDRLPSRCRSVLELRYGLGCQPVETARRLGYRSSGRERGAYRELLRDYDRHTTLVREAYLRILGVEG